MTISSETNKSGPYTGNGVTTQFDFDFKIEEASHLLVIRTDTSGVETTLASSAYQVTLDADKTGTITLQEPLAAGEKITFLLNPPFTQLTDLPNQGAWNPEVVESALDKLTSCLLKLREEVSRSVKIKASSDLADLDDLLADVERLADAAPDVKALNGVKADLTACAANISAIIAADEKATNAATSAQNASLLRDEVATMKGLIEGIRDQAIAAKDAAEAAKVAAEAATPISASTKGRELIEKATEAEMRTVLGAASDAAVQSVVNALAEKATTVALNNLQTQVNNFSGSPVGSILTWAFETPPDDYLELNGAILSRTDYPLLFSAVNGAGMLQTEGSKQHTQWGNGDGSTTFSLPDWRGEHLIGWDHGRGVDAGRGMLTWQADAVKSHRHLGGIRCANDHSAHYGSINPYVGYVHAANLPGGTSGNSYRYYTSTEGAATNRVRTVAVMFLVKFR